MMDSCTGVEQDLDKASAKFNSLNDSANRMLQDVIDQVESLRREIAKQPPNGPLTEPQSQLVSDVANTIKQSVFQISTDHRELHASVSRVGKSIDRHFIADYAAVAPRAESFCSDANRPLMHQAIAQHLYRQVWYGMGTPFSAFGLKGGPLCVGMYRQGLEDVGDTFVAEGQVTGVERACTFAILQRCAAALVEGDPSLALEWVEKRADQLTHSPLPFALHRMQALKLAREQGVGAAIEYARQTFPRHAARHERQLAACVCALAWCTPHAPPPPSHYTHLLDERATGAEASELFIKEACSLLRVAPLSPLAGAVAAGCRVLPALHDIRAKMSHPHVIAAWSDDELPFEVDLGEDGGNYHSVFACPILRQQASHQNPPMRLLCGHVISRDALNKLATGAKDVTDIVRAKVVVTLRRITFIMCLRGIRRLKCPYCPMEQSPSEARQIYFS